MNSNEKKFIRSIVDLESNINKAKQYIKENYDIDCEFNEENNTLKLSCNNSDKALNLISAKEYIKENFDENLITLIY